MSTTAVEIALHECKAEFKRYEVDPEKSLTKVFLKKSLFGRVRLLVEHNNSGDFSISETLAVLLYLAEYFPESESSDFNEKAVIEKLILSQILLVLLDRHTIVC